MLNLVLKDLIVWSQTFAHYVFSLFEAYLFNLPYYFLNGYQYWVIIEFKLLGIICFALVLDESLK